MGSSRPLHQSMHTAVLLRTIQELCKYLTTKGTVTVSHRPTTTLLLAI
jgi:hypothetical protein